MGNPPHRRAGAASEARRHGDSMTRVAVLYGGISAEREVSLLHRPAGDPRAARGRLRRHADRGRRRPRRRHRRAHAAPRRRVQRAARPLRRGRRDPGRARLAGIPYTHSGVRASALAMDKVAAKAIFAAAGLPIARGRVVPTDELEAADPLPLPYVVKPVERRLVGRRRDHPRRRQPPRRGRARLALRQARRWSRNTSPAAN